MKTHIVPTVYVPVGIPASGKSFWWEYSISKKLLPVKSCKRIQIDAIRGDICGDINDFSQESMVDKVALSNLKNFCSYKVPLIYFDDLNLEKNKRILLNEVSKEYGYKTTAIVFLTDVEVCINRLEKTIKKIPIDLFKKHIKMLEDYPVEYDEGWDDILIVK